ncbi:MAG: hypothetical protein ABFD86_05080 [Bryobacteraceae bacterium]
MPHDANGVLVEVGAQVIIRATVTAVYTGEEFCNAEVQLAHRMPPYKEHMKLDHINTRQLEVTPRPGISKGKAAYEALANALIPRGKDYGFPDWEELPEDLQAAVETAAETIA